MKHTLVVLLLVVSFFTPQVQATIPTDNTALIQKLLAQIVVLQAELAKLIAAKGGGESTPSCTFTRLLKQGTQGTDVTCLQTYLKKKGHFTGTPTGTFGPVTEAAVSAWQHAEGIVAEPWEYGHFGEQSRVIYAKDVATTMSVPTTPLAPVPVPVPGSPVPVIKTYSPKGSIAYASSIPLTVTTDIPATCKFGTSNDTYTTLPQSFAGINTLEHSASVFLPEGTTEYQYYVRCVTNTGVESGKKKIAFSLTATATIPTEQSTSASTWYVSENGAGLADGTSPTNAFAGFVDAWANPNDIDAGDTLYVMGNITGPTHTIGDSGGRTEGNIVIDCRPPGQSARGIMTGTTDSNPIFYVDDREYITLQNCDFRPSPTLLSQTFAVRMVVRTKDRPGNKILNNIMTNPYATDITNVHSCLVVDGSTFFYTNLIIEGNTFYNCGMGAPTKNSDGAVINAAGFGLVVRNNIAYGNNTDGIDISGGPGLIVERNLTYNNGFDGIKLHCGSHDMGNGRVSSNISFGNAVYAYTFEDFYNTTVTNNIGVIRSTAISPYQGVGPALNAVYIQNVNTGTCTQNGNTYINNHFESTYANGVVRIADKTRANFVEANTWDANNLRQTGAGSTIIDWTPDSANDVTVSNFSTWQTSHPLDITVTPDFVSGSAPTTASGFRLNPSSSLIGRGLKTGTYTDYLGTKFNNPPSIGAFESDGSVSIFPTHVSLTSSHTQTDILQDLLTQLKFLQAELNKLKE